MTIEEFIIRAFERELKTEPNAPSHPKRVTLPLIPSKEPGTLDLKDFNFDDLLALMSTFGLRLLPTDIGPHQKTPRRQVLLPPEFSQFSQNCERT